MTQSQVPPASFKDPAVAARVRDAIGTHVKKTLRKISPPPKKGRVIDVDFLNNTAMVWFAGDAAPVKCNILTNTEPGKWATKDGSGDGSSETSTVGTGSIVIVETRFNKLYITQVLSGGQFASDLRVAGITNMSYGEDTLPRYDDGGDYTYSINFIPEPFTVDELLAGGPYALNIGPFKQSPVTFGRDGTFDVDVIFGGMTAKRYSWTMYPYMAYRNAFGTTTNQWWRVLPYAVHEDALQTKTTALLPLNRNPNFDTGLDTWSNHADAQMTVTWTNSDSHTADGTGCMVLQPNVQHTPMKVAQGTQAGEYVHVVPGATYNYLFWCKPSVTTSVVAAIDWISNTGSILSTSSGSSTSCPAGVWTPVLISAAQAPAAAVAANPVIAPQGTVLITTTIKIDEDLFGAHDNANKTEYDLEWGLLRTIDGSLDDDPNDSPGEFWLRIYIHHFGPTVDLFGDNQGIPNFVVRHRNTHSWSIAKSTKTGLPVYQYDLDPVLMAGYYGVHDANTPFTADSADHAFLPQGSWSTGPWRNPELDLARRLQLTLSGGGTKSYDGTRFKWTGAFEFGGVGRLQNALPLGAGTLTMPTSGIVPIVPTGNTALTATAAGIPLAAGQSLWYMMSPNMSTTTLPAQTYHVPSGDPSLTGGLFVLDSTVTAARWAPPEYAVLIAYREVNSPTCRLGTGEYVSTGVELALTSSKSLTIRGIEAGRVKVYSERIASAVSTTASNTEQLVFTTAQSIVFRAGFAYEIIALYQLKSAALQQPASAIRETNVSGTVLINPPRVQLTTTGQDHLAYRRDVVKNATGSDITVPLCITISPNATAATLVTLDGAAAPSQNYIEVWEIGDAADWPNNLQV